MQLSQFCSHSFVLILEIVRISGATNFVLIADTVQCLLPVLRPIFDPHIGIFLVHNPLDAFWCPAFSCAVASFWRPRYIRRFMRGTTLINGSTLHPQPPLRYSTILPLNFAFFTLQDFGNFIFFLFEDSLP